MTNEKKQEIQVAIKNTEPKDFDDSKAIPISVAAIDALRSPAISAGLKSLTAGMKGAYAIKFVGSAALSYPTTMISICLDSDEYGWKRATIKGVTSTGLTVLACLAFDFVITEAIPVAVTAGMISATAAPVATIVASAIAAGIISYEVSDFMDKYFVEIEKNIKNLGSKKTVKVQLDINNIISKLNSDKSMTDISDDFYIKYVSEFTKKEEPYFAKQLKESKKNNKNNEKEEILKPKHTSKRNKSNKIEEKKNDENNIEIEKINSEDDVENNAVLKGSVEKTEVDIEYEDNNSLNTLDGLFKTMKEIDDTVNMFNFSFLDELNNSFKPEFNFDELMNNRMNDVNDINSIHNNNEEKNVIETVLNKEKKKKIKYRLRVSPWEILVFDTKEEFIDKVGEIIADELRQAVINRSYADGYFKPGRV